MKKRVSVCNLTTSYVVFYLVLVSLLSITGVRVVSERPCSLDYVVKLLRDRRSVSAWEIQ
jgi:hypothetical protein